MPINADQLDDGPEELFTFGEGTQPYRILQFLFDHADQAYTQTEIHEETGINRSSVGVVLSRLEDRDLVKHRGKYWTVADDSRLGAFASQQAASSDTVSDDYYGE